MMLFRPWVGTNYDRTGFSGKRVLVLGESHYGQPDEETSAFTIKCVEALAKGATGHGFFTKVAKMFIDAPVGTGISQSVRSEFWDSVAFYNFVQSFPSHTARKRPTAAMWKQAAGVYPGVMAELRPDFVLVLGRALSSHLPASQQNAVFCHTSHPSSFGFQPQVWRPHVLSMLNTAGSTD